MMKILVTGATGSIGQSLMPLLKKHEIITIGKSAGTHTQQHIDIDLSNDWNASKLPAQVDCIIHLAQSPKFRDFPKSALEVYNVNTLSTLRLADYAVKANVKKFVYASSGGIYGNRENGFTEEDNIATGNLGFYLGTKLSSEIILDSYKDQFPVDLLRLFFVYGPNQNNDMLIPRLVSNITREEPITITEDGGLRLNPIWVEDAAKSISSCITRSSSNIFNISGNQEFSFKELCNTIGEIVGHLPNFKVVSGTSHSLVGKNNKMLNELHIPQVDLKAGIEELVKARSI